MPLEGNPSNKELSKNERLSGTFLVSLELGPNAEDTKESSIPLSKESFRQMGAIQPFQLLLTGQWLGFLFTQTSSAISKLYEWKTSDKEETWHHWNENRKNSKMCHIGKVISCK